MNAEADAAPTAEPKRILVTSDAVGGVWQYTVDLVRCLLMDRLEVLVATMGPSPSDEQRSQLPQGVRLVVSNYALEWSSDPWREVRAAGDWLMTLQDDFKPHIVHLNGYVHAELAWRCPVLVVAHSCVLSWWQAVRNREPDGTWQQYRQQVRAGLLACDLIVAPSDFMAGEIAAHYHIPKEKIRAIWNYSLTFAPGCETKEPFCLSAGRAWDEAKNFSLLRDVAGQTSWPIQLAGSDKQDGEWKPVQLLGRVPHAELLELMSRASVFLHPALYEPFGLAVLEAARSGCCLLLGDTAAARELWDGAAFFVDPKDPASWVALLNRLASNPEECVRRGHQALRHSMRYNQSTFHVSMKRVYGQMSRPAAKWRESAA